MIIFGFECFWICVDTDKEEWKWNVGSHHFDVDDGKGRCDYSKPFSPGELKKSLYFLKIDQIGPTNHC